MRTQLVHTQTSGNVWAAYDAHSIYKAEQQVPLLASEEAQLSELTTLEEQMERFEKEHNALVSELRKFYVMPTDATVISFFRSHRRIPELLIQASSHLSKYFGNAVFELRASADEYGWENLYVDAIWQGEAHDAVRAIERFEDEWWLSASSSASGVLTFTYRLV